MKKIPINIFLFARETVNKNNLTKFSFFLQFSPHLTPNFSPQDHEWYLLPKYGFSDLSDPENLFSFAHEAADKHLIFAHLFLFTCKIAFLRDKYHD